MRQRQGVELQTVSSRHAGIQLIIHQRISEGDGRTSIKTVRFCFIFFIFFKKPSYIYLIYKKMEKGIVSWLRPSLEFPASVKAQCYQ